MFEMYKSKKQKLSEEQYILLKKSYLGFDVSAEVDYNLIREIVFSKNNEITIKMNQLNSEEIFIEKKSEWNGIKYESRDKISKEECQSILLGDIKWMEESDRPIIHSLYLQMRYNKVKPKLVREYMEETCLDRNGKKRVIFNYGNSWSKKKLHDFFDGNTEFESKNNNITASIQTSISVPDTFFTLSGASASFGAY